MDPIVFNEIGEADINLANTHNLSILGMMEGH